MFQRSAGLYSLFILVFLQFQWTLVAFSSPSATQISSWFQDIVTQYESDKAFDAFVFSHFRSTLNGTLSSSSTIQYEVRGRCYSLTGEDIGPPKPDTSLFRIGSVGKLVTAAALLQLYEQGKFSLNDLVVKYVPSLKPLLQDNPLTILDLLHHTTGLDERMLDVYIPGNGYKESAKEESEQLFTTNLVPAGTRITYSNLGLTIMGAVIEGVSGKLLSTYFQDNIGAPLGIADIKFHYDLKGDYSRVCYPKGAIGFEPYQIRTAPSGDIYMTTAGISTFLLALLQGRASLFANQSTSNLMMQRSYPLAFDAMAMIFYRQKYRNQTIISKDGGVFHFTSNAALYPDSGIGIFAASTIGTNQSRVFMEEKLMFQYVNSFLSNGTQIDEYPYPTENSLNLANVAGSYIGTRGGQKSPLKLLYMLGVDQWTWQASDQTLMNRGVVFRAAQLNNLPKNQVLLQASTKTTHDNSTRFALVTFESDTREKVKHVEIFPDLGTSIPTSSDWKIQQATVLGLFACDLVVQLLSMFAFPVIACCRKCRGRRIFPEHNTQSVVLAGAAWILCLLSWISAGFFISIAFIPYPKIFFGVPAPFVALQVLNILRIFVIFTAFILAAAYKIRSKRYQIVPGSKTQESGQTEKPLLVENQIAPFVLWTILFCLQVAGIAGLYALNLINFTLW